MSGPAGGAPLGAAPLGAHLLATYEASFRRQKRQAERAMAQLAPPEFHARLDPGSNSVAVLVRHLAGNLRSRWRDPLGADGESPDRDRDGEFADAVDDREALLRAWEEGWEALFAALARFTPDDLLATVTIRGRPYTLVEALARQLDHYAGHVGQIVMLAKHLRGDAWETLSIPRAGDAPRPPPELAGVELRTDPEIDGADLDRLYAAAWPGHRPPYDFAPELTRALTVVGAYAGEELIGFVRLAWDGGVHAFLLEPTVRPDHRRRGVGRALVERAVAAARERGLEWVHVDFEPHLRAFYRACGFVPTDAGLVRLRPPRETEG